MMQRSEETQELGAVAAIQPLAAGEKGERHFRGGVQADMAAHRMKGKGGEQQGDVDQELILHIFPRWQSRFREKLDACIPIFLIQLPQDPGDLQDF